MKCPNCNTENRYNATVCESCGTSLIESPSEDSIDLDRFAPAHSDPLVASDAPAPADQTSDSADSGFGAKMKELLGKAGKGAVAFFGKCGELLKSCFTAVKKWFSSAAAWISDKVKVDNDTSAAPQRDGNNDNDDDDGEKFRKTILAIALGVVAVILVILSNFCSACSSCSCSACTPDSLAGTWVRYDDQFDGYSVTDFVVELCADGTVMQNGQKVGEYELAENGILSLTINNMTYIASTSADAEFVDVYLENSTYAGLRLAKLSGETGLAGEEIARLYPEE